MAGITRKARVASMTLAASMLVSGRAGARGFDGINDYGDVGLLQTPTARMMDDGEFGAGISHVRPYNQAHAFLQALPWFETGFRYTDVTDVLYGPQSFSGNQSYKDRSFHLKLRLLDEDESQPALAVGIEDLGGTGVFASEYLVASRRYYDLDFSLGLGWGRLGAGGHLKNPLGLLSSHFNQDRAVTDASGSTPGGLGLGRLFTGKTVGLFGGVQWRTPLQGLSLRLEFDGNDYQHEALGNRFRQNLPLNVGIAYAPLQTLDMSLGYERGNAFMFNVNLRANLQSARGPRKSADPPLPPIRQRAADQSPEHAAAASSTGQRAVVDSLKARLAQQGFSLLAVNFGPGPREIQVWISQGRYYSLPRVVGRTARVLTELAPDAVERFTIIEVNAGMETSRVMVLRKDFESAARDAASPEELRHDTEFLQPRAGDPAADFTGLQAFPQFSWDMGPAVRQQIGGPNGFYFGQLWWRLDGGVAVSPHWNFAAQLGFNLINNFDGLKNPSNSVLPHVRSDIVQYLKQGQNALIRLETNYVWAPVDRWYARLSGGLFEEMYGGLAGELLYHPPQARWAVGLDLNHLWQRGFDERFDFRSYQVTTGYLSAYYAAPWHDLQFRLSVGRYLAGDYGTTIDISRRFDSGVVAGAFVTFTNVSAAQFGEGSFDKGLYISIPFDLFFVRSSRTSATFVFRPLTRDGGQVARDGTPLYGIVGLDRAGTGADWPEVTR